MIEKSLFVLVALDGPSLTVVIDHIPAQLYIEPSHNLPHLLLAL
jgi:hypothetical protein